MTVSVTGPSGPPSGGLVTIRADGEVVGIVPLFSPQLAIAFPTPGLHNLQATFGGDGNIPPATSTTLVEDVRALNAVRNPSSVQLTVTPSTVSSTSQSVVLAAALNGVPDPPANFIIG